MQINEKTQTEGTITFTQSLLSTKNICVLILCCMLIALYLFKHIIKWLTSVFSQLIYIFKFVQIVTKWYLDIFGEVWKNWSCVGLELLVCDQLLSMTAWLRRYMLSKTSRENVFLSSTSKAPRSGVLITLYLNQTDWNTVFSSLHKMNNSVSVRESGLSVRTHINLLFQELLEVACVGRGIQMQIV